MRSFFRRTYKYNSGKVYIKSIIPLGENQMISIINIINEVMNHGYYEPCYQISKKIFHEMEYPIESVETKLTPEKLFIRLK